MPLCSLYEVHYTITKTTAKGSDDIREECLIEANSIRETMDKFEKAFAPKRGYTYEVMGVYKHASEVIR